MVIITERDESRRLPIFGTLGRVKDLSTIVCEPLLEVPVDYSLIGFALEFSVCLSDRELEALRLGSVIKVVGDGVEDRFASVTEFLAEGWVSIRLTSGHRPL
jgi:hypothetical protein